MVVNSGRGFKRISNPRRQCSSRRGGLSFPSAVPALGRYWQTIARYLKGCDKWQRANIFAE